MATAQELLDEVNAAILKRLRGDAYEGYTALGQQFEGTPLKDLYDLRRNLQAEVNSASGTSFHLAEPFDS